MAPPAMTSPAMTLNADPAPGSRVDPAAAAAVAIGRQVTKHLSRLFFFVFFLIS